MIISGTIDLDPTTHAAATATLRERLADLDDRRRATERSVDTVLACWSGAAADAFRERWEEWRIAAAGVIEELAAGAQALDLARLDLVTADDRAGEVAERVVRRLG